MKNSFNYWIPSFLFLSLFVISSCETDDDPIPEVFETSYTIDPVEGSEVSGEITFRKEGENSTRIIIQLEGTTPGGNHPARIHSTSPEFEGPVVLILSPVEGNTGYSETLVSEDMEGTQTTYEDWVSFDGYVVIHQSTEDMAPIAVGLLGSTDPNIPGGL